MQIIACINLASIVRTCLSIHPMLSKIVSLYSCFNSSFFSPYFNSMSSFMQNVKSWKLLLFSVKRNLLRLAGYNQMKKQICAWFVINQFIGCIFIASSLSCYIIVYKILFMSWTVPINTSKSICMLDTLTGLTIRTYPGYVRAILDCWI